MKWVGSTLANRWSVVLCEGAREGRKSAAGAARDDREQSEEAAVTRPKAAATPTSEKASATDRLAPS